MVHSIQHDWQPINQSHGYPKSWPSSRRSKRPQARAGSPGLRDSKSRLGIWSLIFKKHFYIYVSRFEYAHVRKYIWSFAIIAFRKWHRLTGGDNYSVDVVSRLNIIHMRYEEREVSTTSQPVSHACMFQPIWARSRGSFLNALLASCCYKAPRVVITILWWSYWKCGEDVPKTNPKEREDVPEWVNNHIKPQVKEPKQ